MELSIQHFEHWAKCGHQTIPTPRPWRTRAREEGLGVRETVTNQRGQWARRIWGGKPWKASGGEEGVCQTKPTPPSPLLLPQEIAAAQSPAGAKGAMWFSTWCTVVAQASRLQKTGLSRPWSAMESNLNGQCPSGVSGGGNESHTHFSKGSHSYRWAFSPFHKTRKETLQPTLARLPDTFWKLRSPKFTAQPDPSCEIAPTAMQFSTFNGND